MKAQSATTNFRKPNVLYKSILMAGLLAAALDGLAAVVDTFLRFDRGPSAVFKFIASGVFGSEAFSGGFSMVLLGVLFHVLIATSWAFLFFIMYPRLRILQENKYIVGVVYGILIWSFMNWVVLPLSNTPKAASASFNFLQTIKAISYIIFFVGIPIVWLANRYYSKVE